MSAPVGATATEAFDVLAAATTAIKSAMADGDRHGYRGDWRNISRLTHVMRALSHLARQLEGNNDEDHLYHALCRVAMAILTR